MSCLQIFWSESGKLLCIATDESFFLLRFLPEQISAVQESKDRMTEDGIEDAFEVRSTAFTKPTRCLGSCTDPPFIPVFFLTRWWGRSRRW